MNRLSCGQFTALLLITDAFTLFCLMGNLSVTTAAVLLLGTALQYASVYPLVYCYKRGASLAGISKAVQLFYLLYLIFWGGLLFVMLWNVSEAITIPAENFPVFPEKLIISGLIAVVCLYVSSPGEKALSRAAVIAAALGAVCIAIMIISAIPRFSAEYITDLSHSESFLTELSRTLVMGGGTGSLTVLLGFAKEEPYKYVNSYFTAKTVLYTAVALTTAAVSGGIMGITDFPVVTAVQLSQPFSSQRVDSLFLIVFVILAVFSIALQTITASYLLSRLFPDFRKYRSAFALASMTASAFALAGMNQYSAVFAVIIFTAPFVMGAALLRKRKGGDGRI